jgi:hypothetical protein
LKSSLQASCAAAVEEAALQKIYGNTRTHSSHHALVAAPSYDFFIATPFNHRLAGFVGSFKVRIWL